MRHGWNVDSFVQAFDRDNHPSSSVEPTKRLLSVSLHLRMERQILDATARRVLH